MFIFLTLDLVNKRDTYIVIEQQLEGFKGPVEIFGVICPMYIFVYYEISFHEGWEF